jgi:SOS response regulatory protein OraA/RecX
LSQKLTQEASKDTIRLFLYQKDFTDEMINEAYRRMALELVWNQNHSSNDPYHK